MDKTFWNDLELCVREDFIGIASVSGGLSDKEFKLLNLCCLNVPAEMSALMLDLSVKTVQNYRSVIAKTISGNKTSNLEEA